MQGCSGTRLIAAVYMLRSLQSVRARLAPVTRSLASDAKTSAQLYSEKMDKTGRPISPHLMIYRLPAIAWSSVTVRITGFAASAGEYRRAQDDYLSTHEDALTYRSQDFSFFQA